jgi:hypothetical protein
MIFNFIMEKQLRKIEYVKKGKINLTSENVSEPARALIESVGSDENLVLRLRINSPVYIEAAAKLTPEGIKEVCSIGE